LATPQYRPPEIIPERLFAVRKAGAIVEKNIYKVLLVVEPLLCNVRPALMQRFAILSDAINLVLGTWPPEYGLALRGSLRDRFMRDLVYQLPRETLPRTCVNGG
jgi:hypothetical protein